jgi:hypothetical protein
VVNQQLPVDGQQRNPSGASTTPAVKAIRRRSGPAHPTMTTATPDQESRRSETHSVDIVTVMGAAHPPFCFAR